MQCRIWASQWQRFGRQQFLGTADLAYTEKSLSREIELTKARCQLSVCCCIQVLALKRFGWPSFSYTEPV